MQLGELGATPRQVRLPQRAVRPVGFAPVALRAALVVAGAAGGIPHALYALIQTPYKSLVAVGQGMVHQGSTNITRFMSEQPLSPCTRRYE